MRDIVCPDCGSDQMRGRPDGQGRIEIRCGGCGCCFLRTPTLSCPRCGSPDLTTNEDRITRYGSHGPYTLLETSATCASCRFVFTVPNALPPAVVRSRPNTTQPNAPAVKTPGPGICPRCSAPIRAGDPVRFAFWDGAVRRWAHTRCAAIG